MDPAPRNLRRLKIALGCAAAGLLLAVLFRERLTHLAAGLWAKWNHTTVADRLEQYGPAARSRLAPAFNAAGSAYPPPRIVLVALKAEKRLELWAPVDTRSGGHASIQWKLVKAWTILASTGQAGPKLRQGDGQTPEGFYRIESLHPTSLYHLALRVNYPNAEDRRHAVADRRKHLGGDIMIHGMDVSIGCIAIGDAGIEELFVLAADTGIDQIDLIIAPCDLRRLPAPTLGGKSIGWEPALYEEMTAALRRYQE